MDKKDVKEYLRNKGYTVKALADKLDMTRQGLDYHLRMGGEVPEFIMDKIHELVAGTNIQQYYKENARLVKGYFFPLLDFNKLEGGTLSNLSSDGRNTHFFRYHKYENCFVIEASGDSMESTDSRTICDGDMLLIDMDLEVINGDIVLVMLKNGRKLIRMLAGTKKSEIILKASNSEYPDIMVRQSDIDHIFKICKLHGKDRELV